MGAVGENNIVRTYCSLKYRQSSQCEKGDDFRNVQRQRREYHPSSGHQGPEYGPSLERDWSNLEGRYRWVLKELASGPRSRRCVSTIEA